jgi:hypothetical protein
MNTARTTPGSGWIVGNSENGPKRDGGSFCSITACRKKRPAATAAEIHGELPDRPSYSAVCAKLRVLEEKGHVRHEEQALRYVYLPSVPRDRARQAALRHLLATFLTIPASRPSPRNRLATEMSSSIASQ